MKNFTAAILLISTMSLTFISCKGNQNNGNPNEKDNNSPSTCEVEAKVMDYTGLSSCSILLKLADGSFLDPVQGIPKEEILEAQTVKISYTTAPDMMSSCMKGQLVHITCFEVIEKGTPTKGKID